MAKKNKEAPQQENVGLLARTDSFVRRLGFKKTKRPTKGITQMREDPTRLPPAKLQKHYTAMVAWFSYANENLAAVNIELLEVHSELRRKRAFFYSKSSEKTKWKLDNAVSRNKSVRELEDKEMELEAKRTMLETISKNYETRAAALSRELTRRGHEYDRSGRS